jgi:EmrB/QacA subfamily drug resistance transporter
MSSHTQHHHDAPADTAPPDPRRWKTLAVLAVAQFMLILDITVVTVALPQIGSDLGLSRASTAWVITIYTLLFGGLMLFGGRTADVFGARRVALAGLATFTAASLLAGLAVNPAMLLVGRAGQGIGAAFLSPAALSIITTTFGGSERNKALAVWGALGGTGASVGVLLGGLLTAGPGWEWIFFINVPVGILVFAAIARLVAPVRRGGAGRRVDVTGAVLATAATATALYALINAGEIGWAAPLTISMLIIAAGLYAVFATVERRVTAPLLDPCILLGRPIAAGALLMVTAMALLITAFFLGSFYLQQVQGKSALVTGLLFLPVAVGTIVGAHTAGHLIGRFGYRPIGVLGLVVAAAGAAVPALLDGGTALVVGISIAAIGQGAAIVTATTTALANVAHSEAGVTSGLISTLHEVGAALGIAVISTIAAASLRSGGVDVAGFTDAFTFCAILAVVVAVIAAVFVPAGRPPAGVRVGAH